MLDYDDLLLYWFHLMTDASAGARASARCFDHVLVDEYQDTNTLQAEILRLLKPDGRGVTVVGDDAQAIYSFRAARVRQHPRVPAPVRSARDGRDARAELPLDGSRSSTRPTRSSRWRQPQRYEKSLFAARARAARARVLATVADELAQVDYVVERDPRAARGGRAAAPAGGAVPRRPPQRRAGGRARAPQHPVREVRRAALPRGGARQGRAGAACAGPRTRATALAGFRVAQLLPGMGPRLADALVRHVAGARFALPPALASVRAARRRARRLAGVRRAVRARCATPPRRGRRRWAWCAAGIEPHLERLYDDARVRLGDLEQLEQLAAAAPSRERFLSDLTLDPPQATGAEAGPPHLDEDYLILSTIHSAKGQEWDTRVRAQRRRRLHPVRPRDRHARRDRGGAPPAVRRDDARQERADVDPPAALLHPPAAPHGRSPRVHAAHALHPRRDPRPVRALRPRRPGGPAAGWPPSPGGPRIDVAARLRATWA